MTFKEYFYLTEGLITNIDLDSAYELFKKEYEASVGKAWTKEKFLDRASQWEFWGDTNGYIAIRRQRSGYIKLVGAAGSNKSKYIAMKEILEMGKPIWGIVTKDIYNLALKIGMRGPTDEEKIIMKNFIPVEILGNIDVETGKIEINYNDVGLVEKYFIANELYYDTLRRNNS